MGTRNLRVLAARPAESVSTQAPACLFLIRTGFWSHLEGQRCGSPGPPQSSLLCLGQEVHVACIPESWDFRAWKVFKQKPRQFRLEEASCGSIGSSGKSPERPLNRLYIVSAGRIFCLNTSGSFRDSLRQCPGTLELEGNASAGRGAGVHLTQPSGFIAES